MSTHWYCREGKPRYEVEGRNGPRDTTLRDARPNGWVPSVSTIEQDVLAKPALTRWKVNQAILATLTLPKDESWSEEEYLGRIASDARRQALDAAQEGTRIHNAIEAHFLGEAIPAPYAPHVAGVLKALDRSFPHVEDWVAEQSFAHPLGFGGRVDLHSPSTPIVLDFKGKDFGPDIDIRSDIRLAHDQYIQLSAYALGLCIPEAALVNVFVSRTHPGLVRVHVWDRSYNYKGQRIFRAALDIWKAQRDYECGWEEGA